jgi:hypothetical protein
MGLNKIVNSPIMIYPLRRPSWGLVGGMPPAHKAQHAQVGPEFRRYICVRAWVSRRTQNAAGRSVRALISVSKILSSAAQHQLLLLWALIVGRTDFPSQAEGKCYDKQECQTKDTSPIRICRLLLQNIDRLRTEMIDLVFVN